MKNLSQHYLIETTARPSIRMITLVALIFLFPLTSKAQVGIGTNNPHGSAQLDISSTEKGILIPRMNESQRNAIGSPETGLLIFQTDNTPGFLLLQRNLLDSLSKSPKKCSYHYTLCFGNTSLLDRAGRRWSGTSSGWVWLIFVTAKFFFRFLY